MILRLFGWLIHRINVHALRVSFDQPFRHSLPVPEEIFHLPIYVTAVGWERTKAGENYPLSDTALLGFNWDDGRTLPEFCLVWLQEGEGSLETKSGQQKVTAGRAFFYRPGEWHRHRPGLTTGWTIYWVHFNGSLPHQWMLGENYNLEGNLPILQADDLFQMQLMRLIQTAHQSPSTNLETFSWQVAGLLTHFVKNESPRQNQRHHSADAQVNRAVEFIWNHSHAFVDVADVVAYVGVGRRALERRFSNELTRSLLDEIQFCRLTRAKRLLAETALPIKQVIYRAGLRSHQHLCLLFQKHLGISPSQFREKERAEQLKS